MNIISKFILFVIIIGITNQSCIKRNQQSESKIDTIEDDSIATFVKKKEIHCSSFNPSIILNKTFYRIDKVDSIDIIKVNYSDGIDKISFDSKRIRYYGSEEWRIMYFGTATKEMNIDSIVTKDEKLYIFLSLSYKNPSGDIEYLYDKIKIQKVINKSGYIVLNDEITFVDSIYSKSIPLIKETLEDVKKAIGDF